MTDGFGRREFLIQSAGAVAAAAIMPSLASAYSLSATRRVGVIGCGRRGREILGELATIQGVEVASICDIDDRRLRSAQRRAAGAIAVEDYRKMLEGPEKVSAVFIATPTHRHREIVETCLDAGTHVYCEAPLAHTVDDTRAIARAASASGQTFRAGYVARANPVYQLARTFFKSDSVRDVVAMEAGRARKTSWRVPVRDQSRDAEVNWKLNPDVSLGLAGEWGSQQFDVFNWYRDEMPRRVWGQGSIRLHNDGRRVDDTVTCVLGYADGSTMNYNATLANSYLGTYELLRGTNAAIRLAWSHGWMFKEADAPTQGWEVYANRQRFHEDEGITLIAGATQLAEQGKLEEGVGLPHSSLWYAIEGFLKTLDGEEGYGCTAREALASTMVGIKAAEAVANKNMVEIEPGLFE